MICTKCGTENRVGAKFCMECASPLAAPCPTCGASNLPAAKFCSECATPLTAGATPAPLAAAPFASTPPGTLAAASSATHPAAAPSTTAERRLVSILFTDLVGFTPFAEERDSEEVREMLTRYFDLATEIITRYGGTVEKFIGDAVMAVWGTPTAREDDAERSVRAALDLVAAVGAVGPGISARAGVLTGEAAVTLGATNQGMVAGDLVNTAARIQSVAQPGTVLVGEATHRAASSAIAFEEAGAESLKGKTAPVPVWRATRVVAERGGRGRTDTLEAPFVGRDDELRLIKDLYHATVREGRTRLISIMGTGGIGKSRLAWEFEKYLDGIVGAAWWHRGRSPAYGEGITFWALSEMIRGRAGLAETDDQAATRTAITAMLAEHVPDEDERRWIEPAMLSLLGVETGIASEQLFGAWRTFFERLAATAPVILVFEDLHWADDGTLDFVDHLQEWSRNIPLYIVTLARPELLDRRSDWGAAKRSFTSVHLEPLPVEAMDQLLQGLVPGLATGAREAIVARADGVPLYAVETVRMLLAQGRLVVEDGVYRPVDDLSDLAVPETLTGLISARLDELDASDRGLLADAAVLGQSFSLAGVAAIAGTAPDVVEPRLRGLVRRELLVEEADPRSPERGQYAFVQALIREVAYNTLAKRDRQTRHMAAARFFESLGTDELAGALAGHYLAAHEYATEGPEADALAAQARVALRGAAERAAALGSHAQSITFIDHALAVSPGAADRAELHERARISALEGLDAEVAERHALGALEARRELADRVGIAQATAAYAETVGTFSSDNDRLLEISEPAWEEYSDLEGTAVGVRLLLALARSHVGRDDAQGLVLLERMLPVAERLDLLPETAHALSTMAGILYRMDRPRQALITLRGTHAMAVANGLVEVDRNTRTSLTFYEQFADPRAGLTMAKEGLEIASRRGSLIYGFLMVGNACSCAIRIGEWDWAAALIDEWLANDSGFEYFVEMYVYRAILTSMRGGDPSDDLAEAERLAPAIKGDTQYLSYVAWGRAWAAFTKGEFDEARRQAVSGAETTNYFASISLPLGARASLWAGDVAAGGAILDQINGLVGRGRAIALDAVTMRAGLAAREGRRADAIAGYREALRGWRQLGLAFDEAMAAIDLAALLDPSEREMAEAPAAIETARETLARLGAQPLLARLGSGPAAVQAQPSGTTDGPRVAGQTASAGEAARRA